MGMYSYSQAHFSAHEHLVFQLVEPLRMTLDGSESYFFEVARNTLDDDRFDAILARVQVNKKAFQIRLSHFHFSYFPMVMLLPVLHLFLGENSFQSFSLRFAGSGSRGSPRAEGLGVDAATEMFRHKKRRQRPARRRQEDLLRNRGRHRGHGRGHGGGHRYGGWIISCFKANYKRLNNPFTSRSN